jgi:hypothetical protein
MFITITGISFEKECVLKKNRMQMPRRDKKTGQSTQKKQTNRIDKDKQLYDYHRGT